MTPENALATSPAHAAPRRPAIAWLALVTQLLAGLAMILFTVLTLIQLHDSARHDTLYRLIEQIALAIPFLVIIVNAHTRLSTRRAWWTMAAGVILFDAAHVFAQFSPVGWVLPTGLSLSDVLYALSYLAVSVGAALLMQQSFGVRMNSVRLDGIIAGLALVSLTSIFWFHQAIKMDGHPIIAELNIFNPPLVIVVIVLLCAGLVPRHFRTDVTMSLLLLGLGSFAIGDVLALNQAALGAWGRGDLVELSRVLGIYLFGVAAWPREDRRRDAPTPGMPTRGLILVPVIFGTLSTGVLAYSLIRHMSDSTRLMALGSLSLVILRMVLTQNEVREIGRASFIDARTDNVTGLANRRAFLEDGESRLNALRADERLGIVLIDLDGFKEVNDSLGHAHGDELLRIVAERFTERLGRRGVVARLGGDEFAYTFVIGPDEDPLTSAAELQRTLSAPVSIDGTKVRVSASVGVALYPDHGDSHAALLRSADVAMYESKHQRSGVCLYRDEIDLNSRERLALTNELRTAIDRHRLTLHFQPTHALGTMSVHGVEALVRWEHPERGLLMPDEFIQLAERVGLIRSLTRTVLDMAITELARLDRNGHSLQMNVNISQWDLMDESLPDSIGRILDWFEIEPSRLVLEVTESALSQDAERAHHNLTRLRSTGVRVSVDDFGVGYSSMSQLLGLPVDELKVDKSFVLAIDEDPRAISLIRSMVEMAHALDLSVTAEGVENAENFQTLRAIGADVAQGEYFSLALSSADLDEYLARADGRIADLVPAPLGPAPETPRHLRLV